MCPRARRWWEIRLAVSGPEPESPNPALCDSLDCLLWNAACLRGAPSLAARLPPELRSAQDRDRFSSSAIPAFQRHFEPSQSIHVREAPEVRRPRLCQDPLPAADGVSDARRTAAARAGNPGALERDRPL